VIKLAIIFESHKSPTKKIPGCVSSALMTLRKICVIREICERIIVAEYGSFYLPQISQITQIITKIKILVFSEKIMEKSGRKIWRNTKLVVSLPAKDIESVI